MRALLLSVAVLLTVAPARAESPLECGSGSVRDLAIRADRGFRLRGTFRSPEGFDPGAGLSVEIAYEPEADPANVIAAVTLPALPPSGNGFLYEDPAGVQGGITRVKITGRGRLKVTIDGNATALAAATRSGALRFVLGAGAACVRTCGSSCRLGRGGRLACKPSTDTAFCGVRSGCELLNVAGGHCLFPYPSSAFETDDPTTPTGRRVAYPRLAMPTSQNGVHIDPAAWNTTLDGYSPGPIAIVRFPQGVDLAASHVPGPADWAASLDPASPTVLLDADTGDPVEHFGELDVTATTKRVFMIRPGRRLKNGGHYIVALRGLIDAAGRPIEAEPAFRALRDRRPSGSRRLEQRRKTFKDIFAKLAAAGVERKSLILAWDFHTASDDALERWLVAMRDRTFVALGAGAPAYRVTSVEDDPFGDPRICRRVRGTYDVPRFTTADAPGAVLRFGPDGLPEMGGVATAPFTAIVPCSLLTPTAHAGRPIFYGHGLLGSGEGEVDAGNLRTLADTYGFVIVATDWQGMAEEDTITIVGFLNDLSDFRKLPERLHQGILNQLALGRLLGAPDGLSADPAFRFNDGTDVFVSVIDPTEVYYYGNSQGGIFGGTVMALAQETTRGVLGVAAANYSTLLQRSLDFAPFDQILRVTYPDELDRILLYPILQQLWDRTDPNGWYHHTVGDPLPNTPPHKVLVHMATGDDEVANLGTEIMVRSMEIPQLSPVVHSYFDVPEMAAPFDGSALVESDGGYPPPPLTNSPPADNDAHGRMRGRVAIQRQIDAFLRPDGTVQNFCAGSCDPE